MLPAYRAPFEDAQCPVPEQMLGEMYRASPQGLQELVATVTPTARAMLAVYCYRRAHLASIGLAIAANCEEHELCEWGGNLGTILFERSREAIQSSPISSRANSRRKISLATGPLRQLSPLEDIED